MAKRRKAPPAHRPRVAQVEEHSLLLRSAESLGRVIGALQRQLDDASRRLGHHSNGKGAGRVNGSGAQKARKKKAAARPSARRRKRTAH